MCAYVCSYCKFACFSYDVLSFKSTPVDLLRKKSSVHVFFALMLLVSKAFGILIFLFNFQEHTDDLQDKGMSALVELICSMYKVLLMSFIDSVLCTFSIILLCDIKAQLDL